jgi:hypothetical protein
VQSIVCLNGAVEDGSNFSVHAICIATHRVHLYQ